MPGSVARPARPALVTMRQGPAEIQVVDEGWDDEMPLPIVDPADILTVGSAPGGVKFTVDQMMTLGSMCDVKRRWDKLMETLAEKRERTLFDITADMLAYEDEAALTRVRTDPLEVRSEHVFMALRGAASWPTVLAVEAWLRDAVMMAEMRKEQRVALTLWCLVVAEAVGEEGIREVCSCAAKWWGYSIKDAACSGGATEMYAAIAAKRAYACEEYLWTEVLELVEESSSDCFWDWRRVQTSCRIHGNGKCNKGSYRTMRRFARYVGSRGACEDEAFGEDEGWKDVLASDGGHEHEGELFATRSRDLVCSACV